MDICLEQGEDLDQKCSCFVLAAGSKTEHVLFRTGSRYQYKSVPETYDTLIGFWYQLTGTGFWYQKLVCMCVIALKLIPSCKCNLRQNYIFQNRQKLMHHVKVTV